MEPRIRTLVQVEGVVQGVGFRPFVYSLATRLGLAGTWATTRPACSSRSRARRAACSISWRRSSMTRRRWRGSRRCGPPPSSPSGGAGFAIASSDPGGRRQALVSADSATCADCLAELADPADRRFGYPFINCTNCGPRFTIVRDVPYDRPLTTMAGFGLCADVRGRVLRPGRSPVPRPAGVLPGLRPPAAAARRLRRRAGRGSDRAAAAAAGRRARCSRSRAWAAITSRSTRAASRPRRPCGQRKHREDKPFALMAADVSAARAAVRDRRDRRVAADQPKAADRAAAAAGRRRRSRGRWRRAPVSSG